MKFAHLADIHLGYEQYNQQWRAEDFSRAFKEVALKAVEKGVDFVIIAGDLFHRSHPNPRTIKDAIETLWIFRKENIPVFAVEGNHDKTSRDISAYHLLESLRMLNVLGLRRSPVKGENIRSVRVGDGKDVYIVKGMVEDGDVEILGDKHRSRWQLEKVLPLLKPEEEKSILVLHQAVKEVVDIDLDMAYELTISDLPEASYYAFGHIHLPREYEFNGRFIAYPGSVERYSLKEASEIIRYKDEFFVKEGIKKGFFIVKNFKPEFVEIETRELYDIEIEDEVYEGVERKFHEILGRINERGVAVFKLRSKENLEIKKFSELAASKAKYSEIRFEKIFENVEEVELKRENEFFSEFELKLLDLLKGEVDEDEVYKIILDHYSKHYLKQHSEHGFNDSERSSENEFVKEKKSVAKLENQLEKRQSKKPVKSKKTLLDFLEVNEDDSA